MGCSQSTTSETSKQQPCLRLAEGGYQSRTVDDVAQRKKQMEAKVVLLGDSGVGKSSIALRFCQGKFSSYHEVTIGAAFLQQIVRLNDGSQLKLHIWDTGGQERFRAMASLYYRDAHGAVIVYDRNQPSTFESVKFWMTELQQKGPPGCCIAVAANKCDMPDSNKVDAEMLRKLCEAESMIFVECSAKTGENIGTIFESLSNKIYQKMQ